MDIPEITEARRLRFRPGDVLALRFDHYLDDEQADDLHKRLTDALGADVKVLILEPGTEIGVIGPEDDEAAKPTRLTVEFDGSPDDEFIRWMRKYIRTNGGGPAQAALGS